MHAYVHTLAFHVLARPLEVLSLFLLLFFTSCRVTERKNYTALLIGREKNNIYVEKKRNISVIISRNMKDIKQYFSNDTRIVDKKAATDFEEEKQWKTITTSKRERVKIRISRTSSKERTCDIVESKNDLIDKTPSPFNGKVNNGEKTMHDETPKAKPKRNFRKV